MKAKNAVALALGMVLSTAALAQTGAAPKKPEPLPNWRVDFSELKVVGELTKPQYDWVVVPRKAEFKSYVKVRANFAPELQRSADDL